MGKKIDNVTLGCDPEVFLEKDGTIISAIGKIGGTKSDPHPISDKGHAVQEDNVAIEWNIPPSATAQEFIDNNNFVKEYLDTVVAAMGCKLNFSASAELDPSELDNDKAREFGCEPDFNVYKMEANDPPQPGGNLRSAGGHIAVGWKDNKDDDALLLVKAMDATLGLKSVFLDKDTTRKQMYGKAGCFRLKEFGVEYRTLSNFWTETDELMLWAWSTTQEAIELVNSGRIQDIGENYSDLIVEAINFNNKELAEELLNVVYQKEKVLELT